ncbi:MAG: hypothetical protein U9P80_00660 [Thermodesulfobacteriota bacterium]|nr:hypothetical protein [Thermodesulfobacteriota bacterium]
MKRVIPILIMVMTAFPLWAGFGLSNVVTKEIRPPSPAASKTTTKPKTALHTKEVFYPYTIHTASWQASALAEKDMKTKSGQIKDLFITQIDMGASGVWFRVDCGCFSTIKDAVSRLQALRKAGLVEKDAWVGSGVPYTIDLGTSRTMSNAGSQINALKNKGVDAYILKENNQHFRIVAGAYPDMISARPFYDVLHKLGLDPRIVKR